MRYQRTQRPRLFDSYASAGGYKLPKTCHLLTLALCSINVLLTPGIARGQKAALGDVHFPISCSPRLQATFDVGVALLHSFEFREAEGQIQRGRDARPSMCNSRVGCCSFDDRA